MTSQIYDCASSNKSYENIFKKALIYSAFKCKNCRKSYKNDFRRYLKNNNKWFYMNYIGTHFSVEIFLICDCIKMPCQAFMSYPSLGIRM